MLWVLIRIALVQAILTSTHNRCFYGEPKKIILQLSSNTHLIYLAGVFAGHLCDKDHNLKYIFLTPHLPNKLSALMVLFNTIGISWPVAWKSINDIDCEHFHKEMYRNDPKFLDRQVSANSVHPDQTVPPQGLHCLPFCIFSTQHCMVIPLCSNFRIITANF